MAEALRHCPGSRQDQSDPKAPHEASLLNLVTDKAHHKLGWSPRWDFATTVERIVGWYRQVREGADSALEGRVPWSGVTQEEQPRRSRG